MSEAAKTEVVESVTISAADLALLLSPKKQKSAEEILAELTPAQLRAHLAKHDADPLKHIRDLRDRTRDEMVSIRENNVELSHDDLHTLAQQFVAILCPPSAEHEQAVHEARERTAQVEANQIRLRAAELATEQSEQPLPK